mgnify:CR=1 FL=1
MTDVCFYFEVHQPIRLKRVHLFHAPEGLDYFMSRGITPRFTTWCPEPATPLGRDNPDGAPLEYHIRLLEAYRETLDKHGLKPPPGYGIAGPGKAVFSVSHVSCGRSSSRPRSTRTGSRRT